MTMVGHRIIPVLCKFYIFDDSPNATYIIVSTYIIKIMHELVNKIIQNHLIYAE